jgi:hypothetical protein
MVTAADPSGAVWRCEERVDLRRGEVADDRAVEALGRDGEHTSDEVRVLGVSQRGESEQRVDHREPGVEGPWAVVAIALEVVEERRDARGVEMLDVKRGRPLAGGLLGEGEQQPEGVAVGRDRVRAGVSLIDQPVGEERLQSRSQRAHRSSLLAMR